MGNSLSKVETIYGIDIKKDIIPYQNYIATKRYLSQYPSIETIYAMVDELQAYAVKTGCSNNWINPSLTLNQQKKVNTLRR